MQEFYACAILYLNIRLHPPKIDSHYRFLQNPKCFTAILLDDLPAVKFPYWTPVSRWTSGPPARGQRPLGVEHRDRLVS